MSRDHSLQFKIPQILHFLLLLDCNQFYDYICGYVFFCNCKIILHHSTLIILTIFVVFKKYFIHLCKIICSMLTTCFFRFLLLHLYIFYSRIVSNGLFIMCFRLGTYAHSEAKSKIWQKGALISTLI